MESMPEFNSDRRELFRINDTVLLEITPIDNAEAERLGADIKTPLHSDDSPLQQLDTMQTAFTHLTDQINQNDREIARALRLLDDKINIISHALQRQQNSSDNQKTVNVNLSGSGIAFLSEQKLQAKSAVDIKIELRPSGSLIHAIANIIACEKLPDAPKETPYHLRLAFSYMSEYDRNLLVKHTLSRQAETLRTGQNN